MQEVEAMSRKQAEVSTKGNRLRYSALGRHLLADFHGVPAERMSRVETLAEWVREASEAARVTLIDLRWHAFSPHGLTLFALLKESHISVHTWPERGYVAVDIFTCGAGDPHAALEVLERRFQPEDSTVREILRGEM